MNEAARRHQEKTWINVQERQPSFGGEYLVFGHYENETTAVNVCEYRPSEKAWLSSFKVTHWMQLPAKPIVNQLKSCPFCGHKEHE